MKKGLFYVLLLTFVLLLAACTNNDASENDDTGNETNDTGGEDKDSGDETNDSGTNSQESSSSENYIAMGITNPPGAFNPINKGDTTAWYVTDILYSPLVIANLDLGFEYRLAQSIETEDNQTFTVNIHPDIKWSDGTPVTAADVEFTARMIGAPDNVSVLSSMSILKGFNTSAKFESSPQDELEGVKIVDEKTVQFITKTPVDKDLFLALVGVDFKTIPKHIYESVAPADWSTHPDLQKPRVTNGPFTLVEHAANQYIELAKNPDYFLGAPKIDKLHLKIMMAANIVAQLQSGEIDMNFPGIGNIGPADYERVQNLSNVEAFFDKEIGYQYLGFNMEVIKDVRVREAIALGIDRKMIVENLLKGEGGLIKEGLISSKSPYDNTNVTTFSYDPEKAKALLQEAGWNSNEELDLIVPSGNIAREQMADLIVQNLSAIGVKAIISKFDVATVIKMARNKEYDLFMLGGPLNLDPDLTSFLHTNGGMNFFAYSDTEMDKLLQQGLSELSFEDRKVVYDKIQQKLVDDLPLFTLYFDTPLKAISNRVVVGEPSGIGTFANVHLWEVE